MQLGCSQKSWGKLICLQDCVSSYGETNKERRALSEGPSGATRQATFAGSVFNHGRPDTSFFAALGVVVQSSHGAVLGHREQSARLSVPESVSLPRPDACRTDRHPLAISPCRFPVHVLVKLFSLFCNRPSGFLTLGVIPTPCALLWKGIGTAFKRTAQGAPR